MHSLPAALAIALVILVPATVAADIEPTLVIRGAGIYDPETMTVKNGVQLWLRDDRILAWKHADAEVPKGVEVLEGAGCTLVPGLFDLHVHVAFPGGRFMQDPGLEAEEHLASSLFCGVTSVLDLHHDSRVVFALRERSRERSDLARLFVAGGAFTVPGGHGTQGGGWRAPNLVTGRDDVDARFDALLARRPDVIKAIIEHGGWGPLEKLQLPTLSRELLAAIAARARQANIPLFTHIWSLQEATDAIAAGSNVLAHGVYLDDVTPDLTRAMLAAGVAYVPTLAGVIGAKRVAEGASPYRQPLVEHALHPLLHAAVTDRPGRHWAQQHTVGGGTKQHLGNLKAVADAGVLIGTGTDAGNPLVPHGPSLIHELELYVEAGLTPARALRAATLDSARILGVSDRLGSLDPGKTADIVLVEGDPTASIAALWKVARVFKAGVELDRAARARRNARRAAPPVIHELTGDAPDIATFIAAFDHDPLESTWGGRWQLYTDERMPAGNSTARLTVKEGVLRIDGSVGGGFEWGGWAGVAVEWDRDRKVLLDATGYDGVRIRVRGTPRQYQLGIRRGGGASPSPFVKLLDFTGEWQELSIPFAELSQVGRPVADAWSAADLAGVEIAARNSPLGETTLGEFFFELDWIRLYRNPPR